MKHLIVRLALFALAMSLVFGPGFIATPAANAAAVNGPCQLKLVRVGDTGSCALEAQQDLKAAGFDPGPLDGQFGTKSSAATRAAQVAKGVQPVSGNYGELTRKVVKGGSVAPAIQQTTPSQSAAATGVGVGFNTKTGMEAVVQRLLSKHKDPYGRAFYSGPIDGIFGKGSMSAYLRFQYDRGLLLDKGKVRTTVDSVAWAALKSDAQNHVAVGPPKTIPFRNGAIFSIAQGKLWIVHNWRIVEEFNVRGGGWNQDSRGNWRPHYTAAGMYKVKIKDPNPSSKRYGEGAMPNSVIFHDDMYIHGSTIFEREGYNGSSHGCVNASVEDSLKIFAMMNVGDNVWVRTA